MLAASGDTAVELDHEFDNQLLGIKFSASDISAQDAQICRAWINRLTTTSSSVSMHNNSLAARSRRNHYLQVLLNQIKKGKLETPFNESPPSLDVQLPPLDLQLDTSFEYDTHIGTTDDDIEIPQLVTNTTRTHSSSWSDISGSTAQQTPLRESVSMKPLNHDSLTNNEWFFEEQGGGDPFANLTIPFKNQELDKSHHLHYHKAHKKKQNPPPKHINSIKEKIMIAEGDQIHDECYNIQIKLEKQIANNEAIIARYQQALNYFYIGHSFEGNNDYTLIESEKSVLDHKITVLNEEILKLQETNSKLLNENEYLQNSLFEQMKREHSRLDSFNNEISVLKKRLDSKKLEMPDINQFRSDMNNIYNNFFVRLKEAQRKINLQEEKLENLTYSISKTIAEEEDQLSTERKLNILSDSLLQIHREEIENLKGNYDAEKEILQNTIGTLEKVIGEKNIEINQLNKIIKNQSERYRKQEWTLQHEIQARNQFQIKVEELEKLVNTLLENERILKYKLERRASQLQRMHASAELEAAARRVELAARMRYDKNRELSVLVSDLENRYKTILSETNERARRQQNNDQKKIRYLQSIILRSGLQNQSNLTFENNLELNFTSAEPEHEATSLLPEQTITIPSEINNELNFTSINKERN